MFTPEQLKAAHAKVKTGANYPQYVQDIIQLGVTGYQTYVANGNTFYEGTDNYKIQSGAKYAELKINDISNKEQFLSDIKAHQRPVRLPYFLQTMRLFGY